MANKKLQIDVGVNDGQLNDTLKKVGELKVLSKDISIQYDIDGKPIDLVINKSLNLQKQVRAITAELRRTKEGTAEFKLLSTALGDAQDGLARANAKSRDFLASLQLIPGPIGEFASQLNGVIGLLKTFSSFSLKDIQFQIKETVNDFKDIYKGFFGVKEASDNVSTSLDKTQSSLTNSTIAASAATTSTKELTKTQQGFVDASGRVITAQENAYNATKKSGQAIAGMTAAQVANVNATRQATTATEAEAFAMDQLAASETTATAATFTLRGALIGLAAATGIGLVIVAIGALVSLLADGFVALKDWATGAAEASRDAAKFAKELENLNTLLDLDLADAKRRNAIRVAELKSTGKSEVDIKKETVKGLKDQLKLVEQAEVDAANLENDLFKRSKKRGADITEDLKATQKRRTELDQQAKDLRTQIRVAELEEIGDGLKKQSELNKKYAEDEYNRRLKELDALIQLEINKDETSKKVLQKYLEERAKLVIKHDKMTYAEALLLRQQNDKKVKEALDEDSKRLQAYQSKIDDLRIAAIEDEQQRQLEARAKKLYDDKVALTYDYEFQKRSKEEQNQVFLDMEMAYQMDLLKIKETFFLKQFQKEQEAGLKSKEQLTKNREQELASNQMRIENANDFNTIYGDYIFGNKGLKGIWEKYFVDLRDVFQQEYMNTETQLMAELEQLKKSVEEKKLTQEGYEQAVIQIQDKIAANRQTYTQRQIDLDRLEIDSKRANADMTIQIGERLTSALGAIAGKNRAIQKAAAIAEGITSIARIITDTSRAIISFSASVAPLGPAGIPIAAAYAVKAKIAAALGIATIIGSSISKLKSIDETGNTAGESGGGQQGNNLGRGYAQGGYIDGPRHAQGGVMINAEGGEAVMTRGAVTMFAPLLSAMNQMGGGTSFANLNVSRPDAPAVSNPASEQAPIIVKTYVVEKDMTSSQNKQARLKDLSTL